MTSAILSDRKRFRSFFGFTLKKQTPITILVSVFCLLICPGTIIDRVFTLAELKRPLYLSFELYAIVIFIMGVLLTELLTVLNLGFLFSKKSGDLFHAIPLTRNELVFSRIAASFIGGLFTVSISYFPLAFINFLPGVKGVDLATVIATYVFIVLALGLLCLYTALFAVVSGGVLDFFIAISAVSTGIPIIIAICISLFESSAYGVLIYSELDFFTYLSPCVMAFLPVINICVQGAEEAFKDFLKPASEFSIITLTVYIAYIVLLVWAISYLFKRRKSEKAGEAYAFKAVLWIISAIGAFIGGYLNAGIFTGVSGYSISYWVFFSVGVVLWSVALGAIFSRGFKTVKASLIRAAFTAALSIVVGLAIGLCAMVAEKRIPKESSIESITVTANIEDIVFYDDFDVILDIHKKALEVGREHLSDMSDWQEKYSYDSNKPTLIGAHNHITITYKLKSGAEVMRNYTLWPNYDDEYKALLIRYMQTEEYVARYLTGDYLKAGLSLTKYGNYTSQRTYSAEIYDCEIVAEILKTYAEELLSADESAFYENCATLTISGNRRGKEGTEYHNETIYIPKSFEKTRNLLNDIEALWD